MNMRKENMYNVVVREPCKNPACGEYHTDTEYKCANCPHWHYLPCPEDFKEPPPLLRNDEPEEL